MGVGPILVTGAAGFIGFHVAARLLADGRDVVAADNLAPYYAPTLKEARLAALEAASRGAPGRLTVERVDLADEAACRDLFAAHRPARVVHLAAQPGVRRALTEPGPYATANLNAFLHVLEGCRHADIAHLVYASSSSVYGANRRLPFAEDHAADHPVSFYAATKRANELMAHAYSHLFRVPMTGLRFFTVYGPWGRPDMAVYLFAEAIAAGRPIEVVEGGRVRRDFTYVDDVVEGVVRVLDRPAAPDPDWDASAPDPATSGVAPHRVYNIGNDAPEELNRLIALLEAEFGREAVRVARPLPPGDVWETRADVDALRRDVGFAPDTALAEGVRRFAAWYRDYAGL